MDMHMIGSLFSLFSGEQDMQQHMPLLMSAIREVTAKLRTGADGTDVRLNYLAAGIANLRYTQMHGAREKALATYAGTIARQSDDEQQFQFALRLVRSYQALCSDLLCDDEFVFEGV